MQNQNVVIIETGCANVSSVKFAVERLGYICTVTDNSDAILSADKVFLPGVGTASEAMKNLAERDLISLIKKIKNPVLGICLGMQLLTRESHESKQNVTEITPCLGLCDTDVRLMETGNQPLPHMGWNTVSPVMDCPLFANIGKDEYFYFVHSYAVPIGDYTVATCTYGNDFSAVIQADNYYGVQFHPERSSKAGAQLIKNFLELS